MIKPNLFIVGAPKCGTTFLYEKLQNHPDLFFPKIKELNYFSLEQLNKDSYYKDYKANSLDKYLRFYDTAKDQKYLVDSSVSYFTFDDIPAKIKEFNPESKVIMLVRNPFKRCFSHYVMDQRMGYATKPLHEYLADEKSFHYRQYISNSKYYEQLKKYQNYFKPENIFIIELERFEDDFNKIFTFLNIEPIHIDFNARVNENKIAANSLGKFAQKNRGLIERLKLLVPKRIISTLKSFVYRKAPKTEIPKQDLNLIKNLVASDYAQFQKVINNEG